MRRPAIAIAVAAAFIAGLSLGLTVRAAEVPRPVQEPAPTAGYVGFEQGVVSTSVTPGRTAVPQPAAPSPAAVDLPLPAAGGPPRGTASWYPAAGRIAAAGPELRRVLGRGWRGSLVEVSAGGRSVVVRISDFCGCYRGEDRERLIDLSDDAFAELAPLAAGLIRVSVQSVDNPRATPPRTETLP